MKKCIAFSGIMLLILSIVSCQKQDQEVLKNIEEIHKENGIPVNIRVVNPQDFSTYLSFTSSLKGIKESTGSSMVSDTVEEILVSVGDYVHKDQAIIRFPKNNPASNYYQAQAGYNAAEQAFKRIENLYNSNGISRQTYDDTKTQYEVQKANWIAVNDMLEVKAPISGYITRLNIKASDNVRAGDQLFTVSNYDELTTIVWVSDHEIRQIAKGQRATANWEGLSLSGIVTQVDLAMDSEQKAFAVHVKFSNVEHAVPSGVTANVNIETMLIPNALVVHRNEILKNQNEWFVYLDQDGYAKKQIIQTGLRQGMYYEVLSGLSPKDKLISQGVNLVKDESLLLVVEENSGQVVLQE
ncbi:efflux RND transporter periplasmic adaptor subunit [Oceanispirochaeta crateris]|uniref:Efflux RND transporter periplasmic adaptor subunit n=1 Tax=Oceanispirochaeta crateris TaxID=2518645 RepID=A0A5C1QIT8_9SPIO|nr:efflux RND transporter periplasmic adaptor subunit [Oceanispirochaeta crateris]QEN07079.1 efflux RND transporter periplasmic adaptor subunit [Oceanispirochaeta crateris]